MRNTGTNINRTQLQPDSQDFSLGQALQKHSLEIPGKYLSLSLIYYSYWQCYKPKDKIKNDHGS